MIKKFDLYKESLLNNLRGPSEDEILNENPDLFLKISIENNNVEGVKKALDYGADPLSNNCYLFVLCDNEEIKTLLFEYTNLPKSIDDFIKILFKDIKINNQYQSDTERYSNEYGVLFYISGKYMEISGEIYYIFYNVYLKTKSEIHKLFIDYFNLDNNLLHVIIFSSFKLNKMLFDNKRLKESLLNKIEGPTEEEVISNLKSMEPTKELMMSIEYGLLDNVIDAVDRGADLSISVLQYLEINNQSVNYYISPIEYAIYLDKEDIFNYLLTFYKKNINIHILETAIELKKIKYVDKLLEAGFNPSEVSYDVLKNINSDELYILLKKYYDKYNKR